MRRNIMSIRAVHLVGQDNGPKPDRLVINARLETLHSLDAPTRARYKEKLATDLHKFMVDSGYNPLDIKFHSTRQ